MTEPSGVLERVLDTMQEIHRAIGASTGAHDVTVELWQALGCTVTALGVLQERIERLEANQSSEQSANTPLLTAMGERWKGG